MVSPELFERPTSAHGTPDHLLRKLQAPSPMIQEPLEVDSLDFGATSALWAQAEEEELDLISLIDRVIPQNSNREISVGTFLTVGAINRAIHPKSNDGIGPWMSKTVLPRLIGQKASAFDNQGFWDAMGLVKGEHILRIKEGGLGKGLKFVSGLHGYSFLRHHQFCDSY